MNSQWQTCKPQGGAVQLQSCPAVEPWLVTVSRLNLLHRPLWEWTIAWPSGDEIGTGRCDTEAAAKQTALLELMKFLVRWAIRVVDDQDLAGYEPAGEEEHAEV